MDAGMAYIYIYFEAGVAYVYIQNYFEADTFAARPARASLRGVQMIVRGTDRMFIYAMP